MEGFKLKTKSGEREDACVLEPSIGKKAQKSKGALVTSERKVFSSHSSALPYQVDVKGSLRNRGKTNKRRGNQGGPRPIPTPKMKTIPTSGKMNKKHQKKSRSLP